MNILSRPVVLTAACARSALGDNLDAMRAAMLAGECGLRPLEKFEDFEGGFAGVAGGWLHDRTPLNGRKYGAASNLAVRVAKDVIASAGWSDAQLCEAWVFGGSSRGNFGEMLGARHGRRPLKIYAPSNSLNSEIAAAVSIECKIRAPWQLLSNGCASGLDAVIWAAHAVASGLAPRALVVSVELPLVPALLKDFQRSGLINTNGVNDPYSLKTTGFFPSEAAVALAIEPDGCGTLLTGGWMNSDAFDPIGLPPDGFGVRALLEICWDHFQATDAEWQPAICPHASGTKAHGQAEHEAIRSVLNRRCPTQASVHLVKPFTGHSLGANGALDCAILHTFFSTGQLPPNLMGLQGGCAEFRLPSTAEPANNRTVLKLSGGMGGRNSLLALKSNFC